MANNVYTGPAMDRLQSYNFPFVVTDRDGNVDTTSAVTLSSTAPATATIALDPNDNRRAIVTAHAAGGATLQIVKVGALKALQIQQTVTDIDLSGCNLNPPDTSAFSTPQPPH